MLDAVTTDKTTAFDFTEWGDIADDPLALSRQGSSCRRTSAVLAIWKEPTAGSGVWVLAGVKTADELAALVEPSKLWLPGYSQ